MSGTKIQLKDLELLAFETAGTDLDYTLEIERFTEYKANQLFLVKFHETNQATPTLDINGLGQKDLVAGLGQLVAGVSYLILYNGTEFVLVGGGGSVGPTTCQDVKNCIEAFTDLDLSNLTTLTLGGTINFAIGTTIDWTNTSNQGTQIFENGYVAIYDPTTIINNNGNTINNNGNTENNTNVTQNFDETSKINYEGDIHVGGSIIVMNNEVNNGGAVTQSGGSQIYSNLSNVLLCDLALATATPINPAALDDISLLIGGVLAGSDYSLGITSGNPAVYGGPSDLRGNALTPAIVNAADFGVAFKFGDANYINVTDFGFNIPLTNTILGVKVEVIFDSTADTVNVDCITMQVFHTDSSAYQSGIKVQEEGVDKSQATTINFKGGVNITETSPGVVDVDMTGGTGGITAYDIVDGTMTGVTPVEITDSRIQTDTPFNVYYESQPVGNITRTLSAGKITLVSDNAADTMNFRVVIFGFGNKTTYVQSDVITLNGAGPWTITDSMITADTPVNLFPLTEPTGFLTIEAGDGEVVITSSASETNLDVRYIAFTELSIGSIINEAYGSSWSTDTINGASRKDIYDKIESLISTIPGVNGLDGIVSFRKTTGGAVGNYYRANYAGATVASRSSGGGQGCWYDRDTFSIFINDGTNIYKYNTLGVLKNTVSMSGNHSFLIGVGRYIYGSSKRINMDTLVVENLGFTGDIIDVNFGLALTKESYNGGVRIRIYNTTSLALVNTITITWLQTNYLVDALAALISGTEIIVNSMREGEGGYLRKYDIATGNVLVSLNVQGFSYTGLGDCIFNEVDGLLYYGVGGNSSLYKTSVALSGVGTNITGGVDRGGKAMFKIYGSSYGAAGLNGANIFYNNTQKPRSNIAYPTGGSNDGIGQIAIIY